MIRLFVLVFGIYLSFEIYRSKGSYKSLLWVMIGMMLINSMIPVTEIPLNMPIARWLIFSLILAVVIQIIRFHAHWEIFPLRNSLLFLIICSFCIGIFDPRLSLFQKFYSPFREMTETYFIIFLGYFAIRKPKDINKIFLPLFITTIIIATYGIFNYLTKTNPYYQFVIDNFTSTGKTDLTSRLRVLDTNQDRYRAVSTFSYTFSYGYASGLLCLYFLYVKDSLRRSLRKYATIGFCLGLVGVFICFSRIVLLATIFSLSIYIYFAYDLTKKIKIVVGILSLIILSYFTINPIHKTIDNSLDIFITGGEKTSGSSLEMRQIQLLGSFKYFSQSPFIGNGYDYINKDLGWGDRDNARLNKNMYGFESIVFQIMIEQGLLGLLSKLIFFISIIRYLLRKADNKNKRICFLGISITSLFLLFSIGTGPLDSWPLTMLFLGIIIKTIQLNQIVSKITRHNAPIFKKQQHIMHNKIATY